MDEYEFDVIGYEDVERVKDMRLHSDLDRLARSLTAEAPIGFDEFQGCLSDNDNDNEQ